MQVNICNYNFLGSVTKIDFDKDIKSPNKFIKKS